MLHQQATVRQQRQAVVVGEVADVELRLLPLDGVSDRPDDDFGRRLSFDQVVLGAALDRLQRQRVVLRSSQDHERKVRGRADQAAQRLEFLGIRQAEIEQGDVIRLVRQSIDGASHGRRVVEADARGRRGLQHRLRERRLVRIVLDEKDSKKRLGRHALWPVHARPGGGKVGAKSFFVETNFASSDDRPRTDRSGSLPFVWRALPTVMMSLPPTRAGWAIDRGFPLFLGGTPLAQPRAVLEHG
jgi:hypothetical protein